MTTKQLRSKKGFTIVELVIVIAVIAILAAVLIPTFTGVVNRANKSSALQTADSTYKLFLADAVLADGYGEGDAKVVCGEYTFYVNNGSFSDTNEGWTEPQTPYVYKTENVTITTNYFVEIDSTNLETFTAIPYADTVENAIEVMKETGLESGTATVMIGITSFNMTGTSGTWKQEGDGATGNSLVTYNYTKATNITVTISSEQTLTDKPFTKVENNPGA